MRKNSPNQKWEVYAFAAGTQEPAPGIEATITAELQIDNAASRVAIADTNPDPVTGQPGYYTFNMLQAETNGDQLWIYPETSEAGIIVIGVPGYIGTSLAAYAEGSGAVSFAHLYNMFGQSNIRVWADLDNDEDDAKIDTRINAAISDVTAEVYDELRGHLDLSNIDSVPGIRRVITRLVGVDLYTRRGFEDENQAVAVHRDLAYKQLQRIITDLARTGHKRVGSRVPGVFIN